MSKTATQSIKFSKGFLTVNGKRCGVRYSQGPWKEGVNPDLIKVTPKKSFFPYGFRDAFKIENNSDGMTDYFESDSLRFTPENPFYDQVKKACA